MSLRSVMCRTTYVSAGVLTLCLSLIANANVRINEVTILPDVGSTHWVELYNAGEDPVSLDGYVLTDEDGNDYEFPASLPDVPAGAFVVVNFDGLGDGADDEDFGDNLAELHTPVGVIDPIDADGDQVSLYNNIAMTSADITDFISWGVDPGTDADNAVAAGIWPGLTVTFEVAGLGAGSPFGPLPTASTDSTLGVPLDPEIVTRDTWAVYPSAGASPGALNPAAPIVTYLPGEGTEFWSGGDILFSWVERSDAVHYDFQLCDDPDCISVVIDAPTLIDPSYLAIGPLAAPVDYYWRVRAETTGGQTTDWTVPAMFFYDNLDFDNPPDPGFDLALRGGVNNANGLQQPDPNVGNRGDAQQARGGPTFTVSGTMSDVVSNRGLSGVTVTLTPGPLTDTTDAAGNFSIANVANGDYAISASLTNYGTVNGNTTVAGANKIVNGKLRGNRGQAAVAPLAARKDTQLLCLDGCEQNNTNNRAWDNNHNGLANWWQHERMYCPYAATAMLNAYYGGSITMDHLAWRAVGQDANPAGDLDHNGGLQEAQITAIMQWALQTNAAGVNFSATRPTDPALVAFINANRPIGYCSAVPAHIMVVDAYAYVDRVVIGRFNNTDNNGAQTWRRFGNHSFRAVWAPNAGLTGRASPAAITTDSDGDGIMDFDEANRFPTAADNNDSDTDDIRDKVEIVSYTFRNPMPNINIDGDNTRPEADQDSDGDGCDDGDEDSDHDGMYEPDDGESDVYDPTEVGSPGDLDGDCDVDADDYLIFLLTMGSGFGDPEYMVEADYDFDLAITLLDYQIWYGFFIHYSTNNNN